MVRKAGKMERSEALVEDDDHYLWQEYYQAFPVFSPKTVRLGCYPRKMQHSRAEQAIVLVHGLSDSPFFMSAIAVFFHTVLGFNVYLPLLQGHGLQFPGGTVVATLEDWLDNINFAVEFAARGAKRISIGGLSTGGALSYYFAGADGRRINGDLYLFSAALGLARGPFGIPGWFKEWLLRLPGIERLDSTRPLVGSNPYRYDRVSLSSAAELAKLFIRNKQISLCFSDRGDRRQRVFAAWSEYDTVISVPRLQKLQRRIEQDRMVSFVLPASEKVDHASVVLQSPILALGAAMGAAPLERANPRFGEMLTAIGLFANGG